MDILAASSEMGMEQFCPGLGVKGPALTSAVPSVR